MTNLDRCFNIFDLREAAQRRLPKGIFEYVDKGTEDQISLAENRAAFQRLKLRTRFLNDWSKRDLGTEIFGRRINLPFGIAPTGSAGLMWYQGAVELARAAAAAGIPLTLAMGALTSAACGTGLFGREYEYEEEVYLKVDGSATIVVNASLAALSALRGPCLSS